MSEIEKLYELGNIRPFIHYQPVKDYNFGGDNGYKYNEVKYYPPFTAEKQIELIKWLGKLDGKLEITCTYNKEKFIFYFYFNRKTDKNPDPKYPYSMLR